MEIDTAKIPTASESTDLLKPDWLIRDLIRRLGLETESELRRLALYLLNEEALKLDRLNAVNKSPCRPRIGLPRSLLSRLK
ncbi:MAG: hypothetical protein NDI61_05660 [Bdellovibrionaceae bacterium]|nr:hypothetical protein [Pseudobdellovibrionaceae bacterium]